MGIFNIELEFFLLVDVKGTDQNLFPADLVVYVFICNIIILLNSGYWLAEK